MTTVKTVNKFNSMLLKWCTSNLHKNLNQSNIYSTLLKSILFLQKYDFFYGLFLQASELTMSD